MHRRKRLSEGQCFTRVRNEQGMTFTSSLKSRLLCATNATVSYTPSSLRPLSCSSYFVQGAFSIQLCLWSTISKVWHFIFIFAGETHQGMHPVGHIAYSLVSRRINWFVFTNWLPWTTLWCESYYLQAIYAKPITNSRHFSTVYICTIFNHQV